MDPKVNNTNIIFELESYTYFDLLGTDSDKLLQGQISIDVSKIPADSAPLAALCNPKGRVVSLFHIHRITEGFRFILPKEIAESTVKHLRKYAVFFKVDINLTNDLSSILVISKNSAEKFKQPTIDIPAINFAVLYKEESTSLASYAGSTQTEVIDSDSLWYWQLASNRIAWLTANSGEKFLPHNLNLPHLSAVDFKKGCFTGQEVIARMQYKGKLKQHLQLLKTDQIIDLAPLEKLHQDDRKVAEVICCISQQGIGSLVLALVKDSADENNTFLNSNLGYELLLH